MKKLPFVLFLLWSVIAPLQDAFVEQEAVIAIECGRLLNPANGELVTNAVVLIQGERITKITNQSCECCLNK